MEIGKAKAMWNNFLDLSKAFDLVTHDKLWQTLSCETEFPGELTLLLRYWYGNQYQCQVGGVSIGPE